VKLLLKSFVALLFMMPSLYVEGQEALAKRPKIGLVLSGGGAKGIAHIPLLKAIDSLGIKIDFITGTSMGSVVGGLYACGYKGAEIESMMNKLNWDQLLSNKVQFQTINIEEKSEFGVYQAELPTSNGFKPALPLGIIHGQPLINKFTDYTFHVRYTNNFDSLPIPFRCMAADIITGEPVVLKEGNLALAMRSSMSIPTVFVPIERDSFLLVDGGLVKNFPVSLCKEMGADIIIGAYTGGKLYNREEMNSLLKLLYQTSSFVRLEDSKKEMELCDVLVNSNSKLEGYGAGDFNKSSEILKQGEIAIQEVFDQLIEIAEEQKKWQVKPIEVDKSRTSFKVSSLDIQESSGTGQEIAKGKISLKPGAVYSYEDLAAGMRKVYGTRYYEKVLVDFQGDTNDSKLTVHTPRSSAGVYKLALHYDNSQYAGVILNYTARNLLFQASRTLFTIDFAENPKARFEHYQFIGPTKKLWWSTEFLYDRVFLRTYTNGQRSTIYNNDYFRWNTGLHYSATRRAVWSFMGGFEYDLLKPEVNPETLSERIPGHLINYEFKRWNLSTRYRFNNLNEVYFPTKGDCIFVMAKMVLNPRSNQLFIGSDSLRSKAHDFEILDPFFKVQLDYKQVKPLNKRLSWINQFRGGLIFNLPEVGTMNPLDHHQSEYFFLGGIARQPRLNGIGLEGYHAFEYNFAQMLTWQTAMQYALTHNIFLVGTVNFTAAGHDPIEFLTNSYKIDFNFNDAADRKVVHEVGYGLRLAMRTRLGPIQLGAGSTVDAPRLRVFWGFGYTLQ